MKSMYVVSCNRKISKASSKKNLGKCYKIKEIKTHLGTKDSDFKLLKQKRTLSVYYLTSKQLTLDYCQELSYQARGS